MSPYPPPTIRTAFFSNRVTTARTIVYLVLLALQIVLLGLLAEFAPWAGYNSDGYYGIHLAMLLMLVAFTVIFIVLFVFLLPGFLRYRSVAHSLWWEIGWLILLSGFWVAATYFWRVAYLSLNHDYCFRERPYYYEPNWPPGYSHGTYCPRLKAMLAFAIINCAVVLGVMFEAVAYGVYQHFGRGKREVWSARPGETLDEKREGVDLSRDEPYTHIA